ncbi:MAG: hypothetical protein ACOCX2_01815 [Armatimonadota bacterium]
MLRTLTCVSLEALMLLTAPAVVGVAQEADAPDGPTVAVVGFDSVAIDNDWSWSCCSRRWDAGYGIANMVAAELKRDLRGSAAGVVDGDALRQLLINERLHHREALSIETAARIARELGADLAVLGRVQEFEVFDVGFFLNKQQWTQGRVTLSVRIIDAASGVVVDEQSAASFRVRSVLPWDVGDRPFTDIATWRFANSFLGRTTADAARSMAEDIRRSIRKLTASGAWQSWDGPSVVGFGGGRLTINRGAQDGVSVGDRFSIVRRAEGEETATLGAMEVAEVAETLATGRLSRADDAPRPRPGDLAQATGQ